MGDVDNQVQAPSFERILSMEGPVASQPDDQSAMTIEFLRARLLAERTVSKAERKRAQQLAAKVSELEQRVKLEISLRRKLEGLREDGKHDLLMDKISHDDNNTSQPEHIAESEQYKSDMPEGSMSRGMTNTSEGHASDLFMPENDDQEVDDDNDDDNNQLASDKGILAWASCRNNKRPQVKEWAQSPTDLKRSFSPRSFGSISPDSNSPRKRWAGKSVRQIRTRSFTLNLEAEELKHEQPKEALHYYEGRDKVHRVLDQQTQLFQPGENKQMAQGEEFVEQICLEGDVNMHQMNLYSGATDEKDGHKDHIASDERAMKDEARCVNLGTPEKVDDFAKHNATEDELSKGPNRLEVANREGDSIVQDVDIVNYGALKEPSFEEVEADKKDCIGTICSAIGPGVANCEDNSTAQDSAVVNQRVSEGPTSVKVKDDMGAHIDMSHGRLAKEDSADLSCAQDKQDEHVDAVGVYDIMLVDLPSAETSLDPPEEKRPSFGGQLGGVISHNPHESSGCIPARFNVYTLSSSSSQGSNSALDALSYDQKHDLSLGGAKNYQEPSEGMSRESSESAFRNGSFVRSPSIMPENDKHLGLCSYEDQPRRSFSGSSAHENSSYGSSKGLMNSSWDEIFKRRIRAQAAGNSKEHNKDAQRGLPPFYDDVQQSFPPRHIHIEKKQSAAEMRTHDYGTCSSPHLPSDYQGWRHGVRIHGKSMDAGLDRVMEVLRDLEIAKQQMESSNGHKVHELGNAARAMPNVSLYDPSWSPAGRVEPFMYEVEDRHGGAAHIQKSLSENMQYAAWMRDELEANWRGSYYGYPPYDGLYRR